MIPVIQTTDIDETLRRVIHSINYSEDVLAFPTITTEVNANSSAPNAVTGVNCWVGFAVDRATFRQRLKDAQWGLYAAGLVTGSSGSVAISLQYVTDAGVLVPLGPAASILVPAGGFQKAMVGPADVFGSPGVPQGEAVPALALTAQTSSGTASLLGWVSWVRFLPPLA